MAFDINDPETEELIHRLVAVRPDHHRRHLPRSSKPGAVYVELTAADLARLDAVSALPTEDPGWMIERQSGLRPKQEPRRIG